MANDFFDEASINLFANLKALKTPVHNDVAGETMALASVVTVGLAFILLGLLGLAYPTGASGVNWVVAGVVALLVGWFMGKK